MPGNMLSVIKKLTYKLRDRWRTLACGLQERNNCRATFADIVSFIEKQVKSATDPVFDDVTVLPPTVKEMRKSQL